MVKKLKFSSILSIVILIVVTFGIITTSAQASAEDNQVTIYVFWGDGCPHCEQARPVLQELAANNSQVGYQEFEVYYVEENRDLFLRFGEVFNFEPRYVPTIFIGDRYWEGWSDEIAAEIRSYLDTCVTSGCTDLGKEVLSGTQLTEPEFIATPTSTPEITPTSIDETVVKPTEPPEGVGQNDVISPNDPEAKTITLPLIGTINLSKQSLFVSTLIISIVDGFNPCSLWVLSMLLAITLNTRSRKKVLIIGLVFIFVTGLIYALFIGGLFTIFSFVSFMGWIRVVVALVALVFALINIKDYFWYKQGFSLTISDEKKPGVYKGIRRILNAGESIPGMVIGTVVLAAGVSLVEFSCTAGLPILWTNLLISQEVTGLAFLGFLLVYMVIYQIDEIGIFLVSVFTLRKTKLEEKHGRVLKLFGGMLMLSLAIVMLINPQLMNNILNALIVFGIAFGAGGLVLLFHRVIMPNLSNKELNNKVKKD